MPDMRRHKTQALPQAASWVGAFPRAEKLPQVMSVAVAVLQSPVIAWGADGQAEDRGQ